MATAIVVLGAALLVNGAFSMHHFVRSSEGEEGALPMDILLLLALGLVLILLGAVGSLPEFRSSRGLKQLNAMKRDEFFDRSSFRRYNHGASTFRRVLGS
jgi:hypothetical protein